MKSIQALIVVLLFTVLPCMACTTKKIETHEQLILRADAIYHARATEYLVPTNQRMKGEIPRVIFTVLDTIKGPSMRSIQFPALLTEFNDKNDMPVPYNLVRPDGRRGQCYATKYKSGQEYLLFIKGGTPYWSRLAPTNEEVSGNSDPWVLLVKKASKDSTRNLTLQSR
jgi:hypothetical protein